MRTILVFLAGAALAAPAAAEKPNVVLILADEKERQ